MSKKNKNSPTALLEDDAPSAFLSKTFGILENLQFRDIIDWNNEGDAFIVKDIESFSIEVLPKYFKHNNFQSFVRQLNMYDFHKYKQGNFIYFKHPLFKKEMGKNILGMIKRKTNIKFDPHLKNISNNSIDFINNKDINSQFFALKSKQEQLQKILSLLVNQNNNLVAENKLLWRELLKKKKKAQLNFHKITKCFSDSCTTQSPNTPVSPTQKRALFKSLVSQFSDFLPQKTAINTVFKLINKNSSDLEPSSLLPPSSSPPNCLPNSSSPIPPSSLILPPMKKEEYPFLGLKIEEESKGFLYGYVGMKDEDKEERGRKEFATRRRREMGDVLESPKHYLDGFSFDEKEEEGMDEENTLESKGIEESTGGWRNNENIDDLFAL